MNKFLKGFAAVVRAVYIDPHDFVPQAIGHIQKIRSWRDAHIINQNLHRAETFFDLLPQTFHLRLLSHIARACQYCSAAGAYLFGDFFESHRRSTGNDHPALLDGKCSGDGFADTASRAGDKDDFAIEILHLLLAGKACLTLLQKRSRSLSQIVRVRDSRESARFEFEPGG